MDSAIEYVAAGIALIDIPPRKKGPTTTGWNKAENAITDPERAAALAGNVGIAHAYCSPSPTMALDIDDLPKARAWLAEHSIDLDALLDTDDAVQIASGKKGSRKLLYRLPYGVAPIPMKQITDPETGEMVLEFRCASANGLTVQDVLPPSIHPETGKPYEWAGKGNWRDLPVIPAALLAVWLQELKSRAANRAPRERRLSLCTSVDDTPRQRARLAEMLSYISADCSYELYRDMVWAILSLGWHDGEEIAQEWCQTAPHRFEEPSFYGVANSYDPDRAPAPTRGTIIHFARAGGWNG